MSRNIIASVIIGLSITAGFSINGRMAEDTARVSTISVTGIAKENVKADVFAWTFEHEIVGGTVEEVMASWNKGKGEIISMFTKEGLVRNEDYIIKSKKLNKRKSDDGKDIYTITQKYEVMSAKVSKAHKAYKASESLPENGISITSYESNIFLIKDKKAIEEKLSEKALADAKEKAIKMANLLNAEIVGVPSSSYSYVRIKDAKASEDTWTYGSTIDQVAILEMYSSFTIKKK